MRARFWPKVLLAAILAALIVPSEIREVQAESAALIEQNVKQDARPQRVRTEQGATPVFGADMFTGEFSKQPFAGYNPNYLIVPGDSLNIRFWGAVDYEAQHTVDAQGNIFIPKIGPVHVAGAINDALTEVIDARVRKVYKNFVGVYANLESAQPVSVMVSGFVQKPGMYRGLSSDTILYYLDSAGGIDTERGSFVDVRVIRASKVRAAISLYDFLLSGTLQQVQFADGDTVFVGPRGNTATVHGAVQNPGRFEFVSENITATQLLQWARPTPDATHIRIRRSNSGETTAQFMPILAANGLSVKPGDDIAVTAEDRRETIIVQVMGEHLSAREFAVPRGSPISVVTSQLVPSNRSDIGALQLLRASVAKRQKKLLDDSLDRLEREVLAARSSTEEESALRLREAELILQFIERARKLQPEGLVVLGNPETSQNLYLEDGDILVVPATNNLVTVSGEVMFPSTMVYEKGMTARGYIEKSGGFSRTAESGNVLVRRVNGQVEAISPGRADIRPGDEILVLPEPNVKSLQFAKTLTEIIYQLAIATRVVLSF